MGVWVTGSKERPSAVDLENPQHTALDADASLWHRITHLGKPLLVGWAVTAFLMGLLTYGLISVFWRWRTLAKRRSRMRDRAL